MSPTAAFLMSFPVVSSTGVRIGEDEQDAHDSQSLQQSHSTSKTTNETNILDNISNLLTTKDYERFVEDAVKNDAVDCETNTKPSDGENDCCIEKRGSSSFDFQLKPITTSCTEVKTDSYPRASVTCTSTYLSEIGNVSYKSSTSKRYRLKSLNDEHFTNAPINQDSLLTMPLTKTSTVSSEDYLRNHSAMDFITSSSTILNNLEPQTKMLRLSETMEQVKRTDTTSFENLFPPASSGVTTSSIVPSYGTVPTKFDSKVTATNNDTVSIPSLSKTRPRSDSPKNSFDFSQPLAINTTDGSSKHCRENQLNPLYSYPTNTSTYLSTSLSHVSGITESMSSKSYPDNVPKSSASTSIDKTFYKPNHPTNSANDGFYTTLTSIGTTHSSLPQYPNTRVHCRCNLRRIRNQRLTKTF